MKDVFSRAYNEMWWGRGSGVGSTVSATVEYRAYVAGIMHGLRVRTVLDIGCGDWEFSRLMDWTNIRYTGWDVVPQVIKRNQALFRFASFACVDARTVPIPDVDLIIMKDVLQHWPIADVQEFLKKIAGRTALITNSNWESSMTDIPAGGFRPLNLREDPFFLNVESEFVYCSKGQEDRKSILLVR